MVNFEHIFTWPIDPSMHFMLIFMLQYNLFSGQMKFLRVKTLFELH